MVDTWYKPAASGGQILSRLEVYNATICAMVELSLQEWNSKQPRNTFRRASGVGIQVAGAGYQVKSIMWTLYIVVSKFMESQEHFAEAEFKTRVKEEIYGFGRYFEKLSRGNHNRLDSTPPENSTLDAGAIGSEQITTSSASSPMTDLTISNHTATSLDTRLNAKDAVDFRAEWILNGKIYNARQVLSTIMKLIIDIGEEDPEHYSAGIAYYKTDGDFHILVHATSQAARENLKNYVVVFALQACADGLMRAAPGGRWQEFNGIIRWYAKIVGKILLRRGKLQPPPVLDDGAGLVDGENVAAVA